MCASSLRGAPVLLINPRSGGGKARRVRLADLARERGIEPVTMAGGDGLEALIEEVLLRALAFHGRER